MIFCTPAAHSFSDVILDSYASTIRKVARKGIKWVECGAKWSMVEKRCEPRRVELLLVGRVRLNARRAVPSHHKAR